MHRQEDLDSGDFFWLCKALSNSSETWLPGFSSRCAVRTRLQCFAGRGTGSHHEIHFHKTNSFCMVWLPCQSWSRARRFDFGPPPLRDDGKELWGRKGLSSSDQQKVNLGNLLLLATILMVVQLRQRNIAWIVGNPWTSRCWLTGYFRALMASGAKLQQLDYCQFGMPWKKATGFCFEGLAWNGLFRTCESKFGRCNKTHKKHIILQGKDPTGVWWTHRAQAYPDRLCHDIFLCLRPEHK